MLHSDIKPSNVLFDWKGQAFVADMGVAQLGGSTARSALGCSGTHAAPEQLLGERCTYAADMYSFGIMLAEIATGQVVCRRGQWRLPCVPEECPQAVFALIQDCTDVYPQHRPSAAQALQRLQQADNL